jgi:hypothetical protein
MSPPESGPNSGGDLFDMAKDGTNVPDDSAKPRLIPSIARSDQYGTTKASEADPNFLGGINMAEVADNAGDIPRVSILSTSLPRLMSLSHFLKILLTLCWLPCRVGCLLGAECPP